MLPLIQGTILEFQVNYLVSNNITSIIVFSVSQNLDPIQRLVDQIARKLTKYLDIKVYTSEEAVSMGDVLREIHSYNIVRGDFILLSPETITNASL